MLETSQTKKFLEAEKIYIHTYICIYCIYLSYIPRTHCSAWPCSKNTDTEQTCLYEWLTSCVSVTDFIVFLRMSEPHLYVTL